jgi:hypothetical protein
MIFVPERFAKKVHYRPSLVFCEVSKKAVCHLAPYLRYVRDDSLALRGDLNKLSPLVGIILPPLKVPGLLEAMKSSPGIASVQENEIGKHILSRRATFSIEKCQHACLRMVESQDSKASFGNPVPSAGELADDIEKRKKGIHV